MGDENAVAERLIELLDSTERVVPSIATIAQRDDGHRLRVNDFAMQPLVVSNVSIVNVATFQRFW